MSVGGPTPILLRTTAATPNDATSAARFHACVRNTGNYFFEESLVQQLAGVAVAGSLEELPRRVRCLVMSMSNFLSPSTDLGYLHDELASRHIDQVVMIGAGAQAYGFGDSITLTEGTRRFMSFVADRSVSIGARGCYTAEILDELGFRNVEVVGCPSAFWSSPHQAIGERTPSTQPRLAVHATPLGHFRDKVSALMAHGMRHRADYVMQSEAWLMPLLTGSGDEAALQEGLLYYGHPCCDPVALRDWFTRHLLVFFDIGQWLDRMRGYDFVYGSRFHGNMAAIKAGVPALNMPFDTRTRELCEYLNLPMMPLTQFDEGMDVEDLRERADFTLYNRTYADKRRAYAAFLDRNGLRHELGSASPPVELDRAARVARRSMVQLVQGLPHELALVPHWLRDGATERLHPDRPESVRQAAEVGCFDAIPRSIPKPPPAATRSPVIAGVVHFPSRGPGYRKAKAARLKRAEASQVSGKVPSTAKLKASALDQGGDPVSPHPPLSIPTACLYDAQRLSQHGDTAQACPIPVQIPTLYPRPMTLHRSPS